MPCKICTEGVVEGLLVSVLRRPSWTGTSCKVYVEWESLSILVVVVSHSVWSSGLQRSEVMVFCMVLTKKENRELRREA